MLYRKYLVSFCAALAVFRHVSARDVSGRKRTSTHLLAPLRDTDLPGRVPNEYIVAFKPTYTIAQHEQTIGRNLSSFPQFNLFHALSGYTVEMDTETLNLVRSDQNVAFVQVEHILHILPNKDPGADHKITVMPQLHAEEQLTKRAEFSHYDTILQTLPGFNLQMIGAGEKLTTPVENPDLSEIDGVFYETIRDAGSGVDVYILDSGIRISHEGFAGRASNFDGVEDDEPSPYCGNNATMADSDAHGTLVAGLVGARRYGVAQGANLINVEVICGPKGQMSISRIVSAIDKIKDTHIEALTNRPSSEFRGSISNMSWGGWLLGRLAPTLDWACDGARESGIELFASAANRKLPTWPGDRPCRLASVICVSSVDNSYKRDRNSAWGTGIDFFAPGMGLISTHPAGPRKIEHNIEGTSFAAPQVAGTAAIFMSWKGLATGGVKTYLWWNALHGVVEGIPRWPRTNNLFATTGIQNSKKRLNEPFRWAGPFPRAEIPRTGFVPVTGWTNTPEPTVYGQNAQATGIAAYVYGVTMTTTFPTYQLVPSSLAYCSFSVVEVGPTKGLSVSTPPSSVMSELGATGMYNAFNTSSAKKTP